MGGGVYGKVPPRIFGVVNTGRMVYCARHPVNINRSMGVCSAQSDVRSFFYFMEFWKIFETENLLFEFKGVLYKEEWLPICFDGRYQISNFGRIKRLAYKTIIKGNIVPEKIRKAHKNDKGYLKIDIGEKKRAVSRLVAGHFILNPAFLPEVNHMDFDKTNNAVWNLEWADSQSNMDHYYASDKVVRGKPSYKYSVEDVVFIRDNFWLLGAEALAKQFNTSPIYIQSIALGRQRKDVPHKAVREFIGTTKPIVDLNTGVFYESAEELAKLIGWKAKEVRRRLSGERPNYTQYRYA